MRCFQVPGGWLSDRFGARRVLGSIVAYWSIMTVATGFAFNAASFIVVRFLFGVGEAGAFPGATRAMQLWYRGASAASCRASRTARAAPAPRYRAADRAADHESTSAGAGRSSFAGRSGSPGRCGGVSATATCRKSTRW